MPRFLRSGEYHYVLYGILNVHSTTAAADALRYFAYKLESNIRPTNSQRERLAMELLALQGRLVWKEHNTRLWYYISASQFADARLARSLLAQAKLEEDQHLQVWALLASAMSANQHAHYDSARETGSSQIASTRHEAIELGKERCAVFGTMLGVLGDGRAVIDFSLDKQGLSNNDLELLLLAYGRHQLFLANEHTEVALQRFIVEEGIYHESPLVSEYSFWCSRVLALPNAPAKSDILDGHPHADKARVRSAVYRVLGSGSKRTRNNNWDYLAERLRREEAACRFKIFSALSTRVGTYDSLLKTTERWHLDAFISWHMEETDARCLERQFAFLVNNLGDANVQAYLIEELRASNSDRIKSYIPIIRRNRNLPPKFAAELRRIGILSPSEQLGFSAFSEHPSKQRLLLPPGTPQSPHPGSIEEELKRSIRLTDLETVVIATANTREAQTVVAELRVSSAAIGYTVRAETDPALPFHEGRLPAKNGMRRVLVVRADDTGPLEAYDLVRRIVGNLDAKYIFFVGCAALLDEKQKPVPNSVFIARRALDVDKREEGDDDASYDSDQAPGDLRVLRNLDLLLDSGHFNPLNVITNRYFLSGSAFAKGRNSQARLAYVDKFPKDAVVLEMEAYAVLKAVEKHRSEGLDLSISVIKGISDFGDASAQEDKDTAQRTATRNAMEVACKLLAFI